jgi:uncharacterized repeat protein (TIGR03833 family)
MNFVYESSPGYYYKIEQGKNKRISKKEFDHDEKSKKYNLDRKDIKIGDKVRIIVKPYKNGKTVDGKIKKILTKKKIHTRGHKILLETGEIGRMIEKI